MKKEKAYIVSCANCGKMVTRKSRNGRFPKFCSTGCRVQHWRKSQNMKDNKGLDFRKHGCK